MHTYNRNFSTTYNILHIEFTVQRALCEVERFGVAFYAHLRRSVKTIHLLLYLI